MQKHLPSLHTRSTFLFEWKVELSGLSVVHYSVIDPTYLPCICFESHGALTYHGSTLSLCSWHWKNYKQMRSQGTVDTDGAHTSSAHMHAPLSHQTLLRKHNFKDKIIKNLKIATVEH